MSGGCQCGRVRYRAVLHGRAASLCHCRVCRHSAGGSHATFQAIARDAVTWTATSPGYRTPSPVARRGFRSACGTPLSFEVGVDIDEIELAVGSLGTPRLLVPERQLGLEALLDAWREAGSLLGIASADKPTMTNLWRHAGAAIPD